MAGVARVAGVAAGVAGVAGVAGISRAVVSQIANKRHVMDMIMPPSHAYSVQNACPCPHMEVGNSGGIHIYIYTHIVST